MDRLLGPRRAQESACRRWAGDDHLRHGAGIRPTWSEDGTIIFAKHLSGLFRVPAEGGMPAPLTTRDEQKGEASHRLPHAVPGGKVVLFTSILHYLPDWEQAEIVALRVDTGERKTVAKGADARYVPTGHLVFVRTGTVVAAPFDLNRLEITGGTVTVLNDVMQAANTPNSGTESGAGQFATASSGLFGVRFRRSLP